MRVTDLLSKSRNEEQLSRDELVYLLGLSPDSADTYLVMAEANHISKELTDNQAEVQVNLSPLKNAQFCSSSRKARILTTGIHLVFRGLKFEPDAGIERKRAFCRGLKLKGSQTYG